MLGHDIAGAVGAADRHPAVADGFHRPAIDVVALADEDRLAAGGRLKQGLLAIRADGDAGQPRHRRRRLRCRLAAVDRLVHRGRLAVG
jgi:hypothetical protein